MIQQNVGKSSANKPDDVKKIQSLLNTCNKSKKFLKNQLIINGKCDQTLIEAISSFQVNIMKTKAYGYIAPGRNTIKKIIDIYLREYLDKNPNDYVIWPLKRNVIRGGKTNNTFGMVRNNKKRAHQGWDFEARASVTPAFAIADGIIVATKDEGAYGLQITLGFNFKGTTLYAFYAHMHRVDFKKGDLVSKGSIIGLCGNSGNASGMDLKNQHLHFEIRTRLNVSHGLSGRASPIKVFGHCPLKTPVFQTEAWLLAIQEEFFNPSYNQGQFFPFTPPAISFYTP